MKVKLKFWEKTLLKVSNLLWVLSFRISCAIYHKYVSEEYFNCITYDKSFNEITFTKEES